MSWTAYVDESEPHSASDSVRTYLLAAAVVDDRDQLDVRTAMAALRLPGQRKVHWHDENDKRRAVLVDAVARLPAQHLIFRRVSRSERSERRRRLCLTQLLITLALADVTEICMESRERKQNRHDLELLAVLRARKLVGPRLRMNHRPGPEDPILWVPDLVAGAVGAECRGDLRFARSLAAVMTHHEV